MLDINEMLFEGRFRVFLLCAYCCNFQCFGDFFTIVERSERISSVVEEMTLELQRNREEATGWRNETQSLLQGLGALINKQFERWKLIPSEKEIGLFLLKGLSHKEVAYIRGVSEATARQQARSIYKKAGLTGRHDLAAFFLEELALPQIKS